MFIAIIKNGTIAFKKEKFNLKTKTIDNIKRIEKLTRKLLQKREIRKQFIRKYNKNEMERAKLWTMSRE